MRRTPRLVALACIVLAGALPTVTGVGAARAGDQPQRLVVAGQRAEVWPVGGTGRPLVVWMHGYDDDERLLDGPQAGMVRRLHARGWVVASSHAHGNAWGDRASVRDYRRLLTYVRAHYRTTDTVLVSASMGALAGLRLVADGVPRLRTWYGVGPVRDIASLGPGLRRAAARVDPLPLPGWSELAGRALVVVTDPGDTVVPTAQNAAVIAADTGARLVLCSGGHVSADCYDQVQP